MLKPQTNHSKPQFIRPQPPLGLTNFAKSVWDEPLYPEMEEIPATPGHCTRPCRFSHSYSPLNSAGWLWVKSFGMAPYSVFPPKCPPNPVSPIPKSFPASLLTSFMLFERGYTFAEMRKFSAVNLILAGKFSGGSVFLRTSRYQPRLSVSTTHPSSSARSKPLGNRGRLQPTSPSNPH